MRWLAFLTVTGCVAPRLADVDVEWSDGQTGQFLALQIDGREAVHTDAFTTCSGTVPQLQRMRMNRDAELATALFLPEQPCDAGKDEWLLSLREEGGDRVDLYWCGQQVPRGLEDFVDAVAITWDAVLANGECDEATFL